MVWDWERGRLARSEREAKNLTVAGEGARAPSKVTSVTTVTVPASLLLVFQLDNEW